MYVKGLFAPSKRLIWSLSDSDKIWSRNYLVRKETLNHFAKLAQLLSCAVSTYMYGAFDCMFLQCHVQVLEWIHTILFAWMSRNSSLEPRAISEGAISKWLSDSLKTNWLWVPVSLLSIKLQIWQLLWGRCSLPLRQIIESGFTQKLVREMIIKYTHVHRTDKYS